MVKQGKNIKKYFETFKIIPYVIKKLQDFLIIESRMVALEKLWRNFELIPRKFHKTYEGILQ